MALGISSNTSLNLSPGWKPGRPFTETGQIVTVINGDGVNAAAPRVLVAKIIAPGSRIYLRYLSVRVVDMAGYDQLYFALRLNGAVLSPWRMISGEQFVDDHLVEVEQEFGAGLLEIIGSNISGTSESGASANPLDIRVLARFAGMLLYQAG